MQSPVRLLWLRRLGILCVALTLVLMTLGAWVKANHAGLACPDWPTCYGKLLPPFPSVETDGQFAGVQGPVADPAEGYTQAQVLYEWAHRAVVSLLLLPVLAFALLSLRTRDATPALRNLPLVALALYVFQALLGAVTVVTGNPPWATTAHLLTAATFLTLLTMAATAAWLAPYAKAPAQGSSLAPDAPQTDAPREPRRIAYVYPDVPGDRDD